MRTFESLTGQEVLALAISLEEERRHANIAERISLTKLNEDEKSQQKRLFLLQVIQPGLAGLMVELGVISRVRHKFMDTPWPSAVMQVVLGGGLVFLAGILIGNS